MTHFNGSQEQQPFFQGVGKQANKGYRYPVAKPVIPFLSTQFHFGAVLVNMKTGDITEEKNTLVVNTANMLLQDGSGVTGAIFETMARDTQFPDSHAFENACDDIGFCPPGNVVLIPTPFHPTIPGIIHLVGLPMNAGRELIVRRLYLEATRQALDIARANNLPISFPSLGTGVYGVPVLIAANWFFRAVTLYADEHQDTSQVINLVLFDATTWHLYRSLWLDLHLEWEQAGGRV